MERIGRYRVEEQLGRGGAGVVYRGVDPDGRQVAIKVLDRQSEEQERRFLREIRALRNVRHPHLVTILDDGREGGRPYLVMELVRGESLSTALERGGALPPARAVDLVRKLALAVEAAHAGGVLHRDLKPDNVLVDAAGEPYLTDFGLARRVDPDDRSLLTRTGTILGTPGWWSPEQLRGRHESVGPATDVYGLGAILYACLTGLPPIKGFQSLPEALTATLYQVPAPPSRLQPGIGRRLDTLCLRCLEKHPTTRPGSAAEVAEALAEIARQVERPSRTPALLGAALVLLGVALAAAVVSRGAPAREVSLPPAQPDPATSPSSPTPPPPPPPPPPSQPVLADPEAARRLARQAEQLARQGRLRDAIEAQTQAIAKAPDDPRLYAARAAYNEVLPDLAAALADVERALRLAPGNADLHFRRGTVLIDLDRQHDAEQEFDRAIELGPDRPGYYLNRGNTRYDQQRYGEAIDDYDRALALEESALGYTNRANAWRGLGGLDRALADHDRAVELDPRNAWARVSRAITYRAREEREPALQDLEVAGRLLPPQDPLQHTIQQELAAWSR